MKASLDELRCLLDLIIEELKIEGVQAVQLTGDSYWHVASDERENFAKIPDQFCVGSLIDDWNELQKAMNRKFATRVDMERLANIMIAMVEEISKPKDNKDDQ